MANAVLPNNYLYNPLFTPVYDPVGQTYRYPGFTNATAWGDPAAVRAVEPIRSDPAAAAPPPPPPPDNSAVAALRGVYANRATNDGGGNGGDAKPGGDQGLALPGGYSIGINDLYPGLIGGYNGQLGPIAAGQIIGAMPGMIPGGGNLVGHAMIGGPAPQLDFGPIGQRAQKEAEAGAPFSSSYPEFDPVTHGISATANPAARALAAEVAARAYGSPTAPAAPTAPTAERDYWNGVFGVDPNNPPAAPTGPIPGEDNPVPTRDLGFLPAPDISQPRAAPSLTAPTAPAPTQYAGVPTESDFDTNAGKSSFDQGAWNDAQADKGGSPAESTGSASDKSGGYGGDVSGSSSAGGDGGGKGDGGGGGKGDGGGGGDGKGDGGLYARGGMIRRGMMPGDPPGPDNRVIGAQAGEYMLPQQIVQGIQAGDPQSAMAAIQGVRAGQPPAPVRTPMPAAPQVPMRRPPAPQSRASAVAALLKMKAGARSTAPRR